MPKLLIYTGQEQPSVLELKPGQHRLGRNPDATDYQIFDPSISGVHCEIRVPELGESISVRDLGSTNGTFVDGAPVSEALVQDGQRLRLGNVEMILEAAPVTVAIPALKFDHGPSAGYLPDGTAACLNHSAEPAVFECTKCEQVFCAGCVRELRRMGGVALRFCTSCGGRCEPVGWRGQHQQKQASFFSLVPEAFAYPFKQNGLILLAGGTILFSGLSLASSVAQYAGLLGLVVILLIFICTVGYLFAFMQRIVTTSAGGENEVPSWPDFSNISEDILQPFGQLALTWLACLAPGVLVLIFADGGLKLLSVPLFALGLVYFPMALLAVSMFDTVGALNPALVLPSILRVPLAYMTTCLLLLVLVVVSGGLNLFLSSILPIPIIPTVITQFVSLYFLVVEMRILGLLYFSNRTQLRWF